MAIVDGPVFQICWVVPDLAPAEAELGERFGVTNWLRIDDVRFSAEHCTLRGRPAEYVISVSIAYAGDQQLELIQPISGDNIYAEFLAAHGPGVHHVAYVVDDLDEAVTAAESGGCVVAQRGGFGELGMDFAYLESDLLGSYVELMQLSPQMRAMFDQLVPEGHRNPWQR
jgi:hypothetical protein